MKKKLLVGLLSALLVLAPTGYFGKKYFDENYVLLNLEEQVLLGEQVSHLMGMAYAQGRADGDMICKKSI